jgi:hypothetical protein
LRFRLVQTVAGWGIHATVHAAIRLKGSGEIPFPGSFLDDHTALLKIATQSIKSNGTFHVIRRAFSISRPLVG